MIRRRFPLGLLLLLFLLLPAIKAIGCKRESQAPVARPDLTPVFARTPRPPVPVSPTRTLRPGEPTPYYVPG